MTRGGLRKPGGGRPSMDPTTKHVTRSFSLPPELDAKAEERWQALGFKKRSEYYQSLIAADVRQDPPPVA